jgi:hypothetical protein
MSSDIGKTSDMAKAAKKGKLFPQQAVEAHKFVRRRGSHIF